NTSRANQEISPALAKAFGVERGAFVDDVIPDSPAAKAGIQSEDVITHWGSTPVNSFKELSAQVGNTPPGRDVRVRLMRNRKEMTVTVRTEKRADEETLQQLGSGSRNPAPTPREEATPQTARSNGLTVRGLTPAQRQSVGQAGVLLTGVEAGSAAAEAGLAAGAVIHSVNGTPVRTLAEFRAAMEKVRAGEAYVVRASLPRGNGAWSRVTIGVNPEAR
ncbi:MAG: PDZ domain-containing protein, partial [Armatimonadetes bacterium]|nr:PDZ domain-containing protein [Armatimonadota bacterium]